MKDVFRAALTQLLQERGTQSRCAKAAGITPSSLNDIVKGRKQGSEETRRAIAQALGRSYEDMLNLGREALGLERVVSADEIGGEFDYVRRVKATLGLGGSFVTDGATKGLYAFRKDFFREVGSPSALILFPASGDSMEPTICDGDLILLNTSEAQFPPKEGELWGIRVGNQLMAKRVVFRPGLMVLQSDNEKAGEFNVSIHPDSQEDFALIGKVKWLCRMVK